jgi:hypothetical protein
MSLCSESGPSSSTFDVRFVPKADSCGAVLRQEKPRHMAGASLSEQSHHAEAGGESDILSRSGKSVQRFP